MMIRLLKPWGLNCAGRYLDVSPNQVSILVARGMAIVEDKPAPAKPQREPARRAVKK